MTVPPQECATRMVGPSCSARARRVASTESFSDVSGFCTAVTLRPAACSLGMTSAQLDPSAQAPCTSTTFLTLGGDVPCACTKLDDAANRPAATANSRMNFMTELRDL